MEVNELISIVKKKIKENILTEDIIIKDKTFLHLKHSSYKQGKFHLELTIISKELSKENKIKATKKIYKILDFELKKYIHSIQILIR